MIEEFYQSTAHDGDVQFLGRISFSHAVNSREWH